MSELLEPQEGNKWIVRAEFRVPPGAGGVLTNPTTVTFTARRRRELGDAAAAYTPTAYVPGTAPESPTPRRASSCSRSRLARAPGPCTCRARVQLMQPARWRSRGPSGGTGVNVASDRAPAQPTEARRSSTATRTMPAATTCSWTPSTTSDSIGDHCEREFKPTTSPARAGTNGVRNNTTTFVAATALAAGDVGLVIHIGDMLYTSSASPTPTVVLEGCWPRV